MKKLITTVMILGTMCAIGKVVPNPTDATVLSDKNRDNTRYLDIRKWPLTAPVAIHELGMDTNTPALVSVYKKYAPVHVDTEDPDWMTIIDKDITLDETVAILGEVLVLPEKSLLERTGGRSNWILPGMTVKCIEKKAASAVRMYLKKQGKSFVTKDGVNPCAEYIKGFNDAMNAPRLEGLDKWFQDMGVAGATVSRVTFPDDATLEAVRAKIVSGEKELTVYWKNALRYCLGLDEYNKFVKEYNGEN